MSRIDTAIDNRTEMRRTFIAKLNLIKTTRYFGCQPRATFDTQPSICHSKTFISQAATMQVLILYVAIDDVGARIALQWIYCQGRYALVARIATRQL